MSPLPKLPVPWEPNPPRSNTGFLELIRLTVNCYRTENHLRALESSRELDVAAWNQAVNMAAYCERPDKTFAEFGDEGSDCGSGYTPEDRVRAATNKPCQNAAEAYYEVPFYHKATWHTGVGIAWAAFIAWIGFPPTRSTLLGEGYTHFGVASVGLGKTSYTVLTLAVL